MRFPAVEEIASREVVTVSEHAPAREALERMIAHDLRMVVVEGSGTGGAYGIVTVNDMIRLRASERGLDRPLAEGGCRRLPHVVAGTNVMEVLSHFTLGNDYLGVMDERQRIVGIISTTDIVSHVDPQAMIERQQLGDLVARGTAKSAGASEPLGEVLSRLATTGDSIILTEGERPVGIITTKDAVRLLAEGAPFDAAARDFMSSPLKTVHAKFTVGEALEYVRTHAMKRIVVADGNGGLLGVMKQRELLDIAYARWSDMMRDQADELRGVIDLLARKTYHLERMVEHDSLTGIYNRTRFDTTLSEERSRCDRASGRTFSVALMDLDYFKQVNDTYGHLCGDEVLKGFARLVEEGIRDIDTFARWGGEEFMLLMPETDAKGAQILAERLRARIEERRFEGPGQVTASIGVAEYRSGESGEALTARADEALYRAKSGGRNRVEVAHEGS